MTQSENKIKSKVPRIGIFIVLFMVTLLLVYLGSKPKQFALNINDVSPVDIEAPRTVIDRQASKKLALEAKGQVADVYSRSEELSEQYLEETVAFFDLVFQTREELYSRKSDTGALRVPTEAIVRKKAKVLNRKLYEEYHYYIGEELMFEILNMSQGRFSSLRAKGLTSAEIILNNAVANKGMGTVIERQLEQFSPAQDRYAADLDHLQAILEIILRPNVVFNEEATINEMNDAFERVMLNPIMINRGSRIVSAGEVITEDTYAILHDLKLVETETIDYFVLVGQAIIISVVLLILALYFTNLEDRISLLNRETAAIVTAAYIPLIVAVYLGQEYQLSPPVYFTAVVISTYFGYRTSVVVTLSLIVVTLPIVNFNPAFFVVAVCGSLLAAHFTQNLVTQDKFAKLIISIAMLNLVTGYGYYMMQGSDVAASSVPVVSGVISAVLSVIASIGLMPLFEMAFNTISPSTLIELSQPGHPLMKRLFLEAPGTSQHSMMVANLSDSAAAAVGADPMICRVGAYYHDIGKLDNPLYFSENQQEFNPHNQLCPEESRDIITKHTLRGLELGKKYKLPQVVLDIIVEHHGNTVLGYFYNKAKQLAEEEGSDHPEPEEYQYSGPLPSSPESAIVMLADSTEAAVKSVKSNELADAADMIKSVFKIKLQQEQMKHSGLKFADIDKIMEAFLQVYAGYFHERVQYPDEESENNHNQPAAESAN